MAWVKFSPAHRTPAATAPHIRAQAVKHQRGLLAASSEDRACRFVGKQWPTRQEQSVGAWSNLRVREHSPSNLALRVPNNNFRSRRR